jgi:hypothetical protein
MASTVAKSESSMNASSVNRPLSTLSDFDGTLVSAFGVLTRMILRVSIIFPFDAEKFYAVYLNLLALVAIVAEFT